MVIKVLSFSSKKDFVIVSGITLAFLFLFCEFYCHRRKIAKERKLIHPFVS